MRRIDVCKCGKPATKGGRCRECYNEYMREWRANNPTRAKEIWDQSVAKKRQRFIAYLREHPCMDCGEPDIIVLEFDHVRGTKLAGVAAMVRDNRKWEAIEAEIAKCDVVCANCHRRRHAERDGGWLRVA